MELVGIPVNFTMSNIEQDVARWFASAHKDFFGNGPHGVIVGVVSNYFVIVAQKVLNKFEKSLVCINDGPYRVNFTRKLLFEEIKDELKAQFEEAFHLNVKEVRYSLNIEQDKSICIVVVQ